MISREEVSWNLFQRSSVPDDSPVDEFGLPRGLPPPMGTVEISFGPHSGESMKRAYLEEVRKWWIYLGQLCSADMEPEQAERLAGEPPLLLRARASTAGCIMKAAEQWPEELDVTIAFRRDDLPDHPPYVFHR